MTSSCDPSDRIAVAVKGRLAPTAGAVPLTTTLVTVVTGGDGLLGELQAASTAHETTDKIRPGRILQSQVCLSYGRVANISTSPLLAVIHEDADLLVVNKPAGLVCHPTKTDETSSLIGRVRLHLGNRDGRLVNRLDRETSGLVIVAKNAATAGELGRLLAGSGVEKHYAAIVHGHVADDVQMIAAPLGKDETSAVAIKDCVRPDGAAAQTDVIVARRFERMGRPFTRVEVAPHTGRKHQIRIHLAHIGHPIVGDKIYGGDERRYLRFIDSALTPEDEAALLVPHQLLHAREVSFAWRHRLWTFQAGIPDAMLGFAPNPRLF